MGSSPTGRYAIWQDGLDIPLMNALEANFYEVHPDLKQPIIFPIDDSTASWGSAALKPAGEHGSRRYSPLLKYEWERTL